MRRFLSGGTLLLLSTVTFSLQAQSGSAPPPPPNILQIGREEVKVGRRAEHAAFEAGWPAVFSKYKYPTNYLAMTSTTGPNEAWYVTPYPSLSAMEKDNDMSNSNAAMTAELGKLSKGDAEFINNNTSMVARLVPGMTYGGPMSIPNMRYFEVVTWRVRPGHDSDFMKAASMYRDANAKAKIDQPWVMYRVVSGAPSGTYMVWIPMSSLSVMDAGPAQGKAWTDAAGDEALQTMGKLVSDGVVSSSSQIFEFSPKMSYVSKEWKAANPSFWK